MAETKTFVSVEELFPALEKLVEEKVEASMKKKAMETYLSTAELQKLFKPAPTRPFLNSLHKKGKLIKHDFGGKLYYKASDVDAIVKEIPRLKRVS
jgi:hypothetical protein